MKTASSSTLIAGGASNPPLKFQSNKKQGYPNKKRTGLSFLPVRLPLVERPTNLFIKNQ
jgi:hypothetical protein